MSSKGKRVETATDCDPCSPAVRNRYFRGKLLTVADYEAEQRYLIERRRLINREMLGWGVVSGLRVDALKPGADISPGVAIDERGRELVACSQTILKTADDVVWLTKGECGLEPGKPPEETESAAPESQPPRDKAKPQPRAQQVKAPDKPQQEARNLFLLAAHYAERQVNGVRVAESCDCDSVEANHLCETVIFSLTPISHCALNVPSCPEPRYPEWKCDGLKPEGDFKIAGLPGKGPRVAAVGDRGTHDNLCRWSLAAGADGGPCCTWELCSYEDFEFDPNAGVPLACVSIDFDCRRPYISEIVDACRPRRLARPNETLFDLIRGCDLTRVQNVGWANFIERADKRVPRHEFLDMFRPQPKRADGSPVDTRFWVCFSGPVQIASLTTHVLIITLIQSDANENVDDVKRIPLAGLWIAPTFSGDPPGTTRGIRAIVDGHFWEGEINVTDFERKRSGFGYSTIVEITVRGGLIVAADGQLLAAGGGYLPSRPGWPGSDFISAFTVFPSDRPAAGKQRI